MESKILYRMLAIAILLIGQACLSTQRPAKLSKTQAVRQFRSGLALLNKKNKQGWIQARIILKKVFQSNYIFNAQAYNTAVQLLLQMIQDKQFSHKDDIFNFINQQKGFLQYVTLPYVLVSRGHAFDIEKLTVRDKTTVFYFTAPWCSFCKEWRVSLIGWANKNPNIVVREIDLYSLQSAAAAEFKELHKQARHAKIFTPAVFIYNNHRLIYSGAVKPLLKVDQYRSIQ